MRILLAAFLLVMALVIGMIMAMKKLQRAIGIGSKWLFVPLFAVILAVLLLLPQLVFSNILTALDVFGYLTAALTQSTGMSKWIIGAIATVLTPLMLWGVWHTLSFRKRLRYLGYGMLTTVALLWFVGMYYATADSFFGRNGKCLKVVALTPNGWAIYDAPANPEDTVFDVTYGIPCHCPTRDEVRNINEMRRFAGTERTPPDANFRMDGTPLKWYFRDEADLVHLVNHPGVDYDIGLSLQPVCTEIIKEVRIQKAAAEDLIRSQEDSIATARQRQAEVEKKQTYISRYVSREFSGFKDQSEICLLHTSKAQETLGSNLAAISSVLRSTLARRGYRVVSQPFSTLFASDMYPERILDDDISILGDLGLTGYQGKICIFGIESIGEASAGIGTLKDNQLNFTVRVLDFNGSVSLDTCLEARGIGKDSLEIQEQMLTQLKAKLRRL